MGFLCPSIALELVTQGLPLRLFLCGSGVTGETQRKYCVEISAISDDHLGSFLENELHHVIIAPARTHITCY